MEKPSGYSTLLRNLRPSTTPEAVRAAFERFGSIRDVYLPLDFNSRRPRGFGFVEFFARDDAVAAVRAMDNTELDGSVITCCMAQDRRKSPSSMRRFYRNRFNRPQRSRSFSRHVRRSRTPPPNRDHRRRYSHDRFGNYSSNRDFNYRENNYRDHNYRDHNYRDNYYNRDNYRDHNYRDHNYRDHNYRDNYYNRDNYNNRENYKKDEENEEKNYRGYRRYREDREDRNGRGYRERYERVRERERSPERPERVSLEKEDPSLKEDLNNDEFLDVNDDKIDVQDDIYTEYKSSRSNSNF